MSKKEMKILSGAEISKVRALGQLWNERLTRTRRYSITRRATSYVSFLRLVSFNGSQSVYQWVVIDAKVYDLSRFAAMHPGGLSVLLDEEVGTPPLLSFLSPATHPTSSRSRRDRSFLLSTSTRSPPPPTVCASTDRNS